MNKSSCVYIYIYIWAGAYPPLHFLTFPNLIELKQFRVKGLGYMSLGFRLPNFPISQIGLGHLGWDYLGNWEVHTSTDFPISQFPKSC